MGLFDFVRTALTDDEFRDALFDAVAAKKVRAVRRLWRDQPERVRALFESWVTLPPAVRDDPARRKWWAEGVIGVASCASQEGDPTLLARLQGPPEHNVVSRWDLALRGARTAVDDGDFEDVITTLQSLLIDVKGMTGSAVDACLPKTYGLLGEAYYGRRELDKAGACAWLAAEASRAANDQAGLETYAANLAEIEAAMAEAAFKTPHNIPPQAVAFHQRAREAGVAGQYDRVIDLCTAAAVLAPHWPYPYYDRALSCLLQGDTQTALRDYARALDLSPLGFFLATTALHTLRREGANDLPKGTWLRYLSLVDTPPGTERRDAVRRFITHAPRFAPGWLQQSRLELCPSRRVAAIEQGFAADPDTETAAGLHIAKAMSLLRSEREVALRILRQLVDTSGAGAVSVQLARGLVALAQAHMTDPGEGSLDSPAFPAIEPDSR